jgi:hypothetical protein
MDVFLEHDCEWANPSVIARIAVAQPLLSITRDSLFSEAEALHARGIRYVAIRRQQLLRIGKHALPDILADAGISVSCLGFAGGFTGAMGMSYDTAAADVRRAIEDAATVGARFVVIVPGQQGLHTYNHAEKTVRMGLTEVVHFADQHRIQMLIPTDSVLDSDADCFRPRQCPLSWVERLGTPTIRPLIVVRGRGSSGRLPNGWRESLAQGGCLRICHRCSSYDRHTRQLAGILTYLARNEGKTGFEKLLAES